MLSADLALSRRLERAEGHACAQFAGARRRLFPDSGAEWIEHAGVYAVFNGIDSPVTQSFGVGIFEEPAAASLDRIERFFFERAAPAVHEVSPLAGIATIESLCARNYVPIEISTVLWQPVEEPAAQRQSNIRVRLIDPQEALLWATVSAKGWTEGHPELQETFRELGAISAACHHCLCFLGEMNGKPAAAGVLCIHNGVALFGGAATVPEMRRQGLQTALLSERMRHAFNHGCDLAMIVAGVGTASQRNAERNGFRIAYTRMKWRLPLPQK